MSHTVIGALAGAILALTWITIGFWAFILVAVAMLIGAGVGRVVDGRLDLHAIADVFRGTRSS